MTRCYRLSSRRYPRDSGKGAAIAGGRWNPVGVEVIYAAESPSLAALEVLVRFSVLPRDFVLTEIHIPDVVRIETVAQDDVPPGWQSLAPVPATQEFGRRWAN